MNRRPVVHSYHGSALLGLLAFLMAVVVVVLLASVGEVAFGRIGFNSIEYFLILVGTLVGSSINLPVAEVSNPGPVLEVREVRVFGLYYRIPTISYSQTYTTIAVNVGGAVIPVFVSLYLLAGHVNLLLEAVVGSLVVAGLVHLMARKVRGVGIVTPALLPPLLAAVVAYILAPSSPAIVAYIAGTMGALIGADLTNLRGISKLGAQMVSIGGAGTFDGVFLTGLIAVLLVPLL